MNKAELKTRLFELVEKYNLEKNNQFPIAQAIENELTDYLKKNPCDTEMWIKLALCIYDSVLEDDIQAISILENVFTYDDKNAQAIIIQAYMIFNIYASNKENILTKLEHAQPKNAEEQAMIEYSKSWFYDDLDMKHKNLLISSVILCDFHVWNNADLGYAYIRTGKYDKGKQFVRKALLNIKKITEIGDFYDFLDIDRFLIEYIKGTHINVIQIRIIEEYLLQHPNQVYS